MTTTHFSELPLKDVHVGSTALTTSSLKELGNSARAEVGESGYLTPRKRSRWLPPAVFLFLSYLAAITIFGKGPTYLAVGPIFWGELVLFALLIWIAPRSRPLVQIRTATDLLVVGFVALGALLTTRDFFEWGAVAARDAAIWYYALFFFVGKSIARKPDLGERLWRALTVVWLLALLWALVNVSLGWKPALSSPIVPSRGVPVLAGSGSENIQNLFLGAAVVLINPSGLKRLKLPGFLRVLLAIAAGTAIVLAPGRGVRVAILAGLVTILLARRLLGLLRENAAWLILVATLGLALVLALMVLDWRILSRSLNLEGFGEFFGGQWVGNAYWRATWWRNINGAVQSTSPLFGLGFGFPLQDLNPFVQWGSGTLWPVRAPHNINMTIYGRMGLIGLSLWLAIVLTGFGNIFFNLRNHGRTRPRYSLERRKELTFWLLMLTVSWVNSSFNVLMEGPVLGVWFWFALGFACQRAATGDLHIVNKRLAQPQTRRSQHFIAGKSTSLLSSSSTNHRATDLFN